MDARTGHRRPEARNFVLPMRLALIGGAASILYLGIFPGSALELARASVEGLAAVWALAGAGQ